MSSFFADVIIYLLLIAGVGFSGIGVIGLLLFPDIRSRRFTAFRAALIGLSATGSSVIVYCVYQFYATSRSPYLAMLLHALILIAMVFAANLFLSREILDRAIPKNSCEISGPENSGKAMEQKK
jgi:multisubunit Na+/H+ antiporter MnhG subunit